MAQGPGQNPWDPSQGTTAPNPTPTGTDGGNPPPAAPAPGPAPGPAPAPGTPPAATLGAVATAAGTAPPGGGGGGARDGGQPPPATLGDVNAAGVPPPPPQIDLGQRFQKYLELTQGIQNQNLREHLPEDTKPGILANIFTMGMAGLADRDYRTAYNAGIDKWNAGVRTQAANEALGMLGKDVELQTGGMGQYMRFLQMQLQLQQNEFQRSVELARLHQGDVNLNIRQAVHAPKTPEERAALTDQGLEFQPDPTLGGDLGHNVPIRRGAGPTGGAPGDIHYRPAAPGSPVANQMGDGGGGTAGNAPSDNQAPAKGTQPPADKAPTAPPAPGAPAGGTPPQTSEQLRRQKLEEKSTAALRQKNLETLQTYRQKANELRAYLNDPQFDRAVSSVLPAPGSELMAPLAGEANKARFYFGQRYGKDPGYEYLNTGALNQIIPWIRAMGGERGFRLNMNEINKFGSKWERLSEGGITQDEARQFKKVVLDSLDREERALNDRDFVGKYVNDPTNAVYNEALSGQTPGGTNWTVRQR